MAACRAWYLPRDRGCTEGIIVDLLYLASPISRSPSVIPFVPSLSRSPSFFFVEFSLGLDRYAPPQNDATAFITDRHNAVSGYLRSGCCRRCCYCRFSACSSNSQNFANTALRHRCLIHINITGFYIINVYVLIF